MSPKEQFQSDPIKADKHRRLMGQPEVREALLASFNELCWRLPNADHPQQSWAANARRQGAREFIDILLALANPREPKATTTAGRLESEDGHRSANRTDKQ